MVNQCVNKIKYFIIKSNLIQYNPNKYLKSKMLYKQISNALFVYLNNIFSNNIRIKSTNDIQIMNIFTKDLKYKKKQIIENNNIRNKCYCQFKSTSGAGIESIKIKLMTQKQRYLYM